MAEVDKSRDTIGPATEREYKASAYEEAARTRASRLGDIAYEKYVSGESGVAGSYSSALKEKLSAKVTGLKEKFDPLNVVQGLTGSRLLTTAAGRALGRKTEDVDYFTAKSQGERPGAEEPRAAAKRMAPLDRAQGDSVTEDLAKTGAQIGEAVLAKGDSSDSTADLLETQTKAFKLISDGKTLLYPAEKLLDRLDDLYDLLDERIAKPEKKKTIKTQGGAAEATDMGGGAPSLLDTALDYIPEAATGAGIGARIAGAGSRILSSAGQYAMGALRGAAAFATQGTALGAGSMVVPAATAVALIGGAGYLTYKGIQISKARPEPLDSDIRKLAGDSFDNGPLSHLTDLTEFEPADYVGGLPGKPFSPENVPELIAAFPNRVPPDERAQFAKSLQSRTAGKEPLDQLYGLKETIDEYVRIRSDQIRKGEYRGYNWEGARKEAIIEGFAQEAQTRTQAFEKNVQSMGFSQTGAIPEAYRERGAGQYLKDIDMAKRGNEASTKRLADAGIKIENGQVTPIDPEAGIKWADKQETGINTYQPEAKHLSGTKYDEQAQPGQPAPEPQPAQPGQPTQQAQPSQTAQPTQPTQPSQTAQPAQPSQTAQPTQPTQPEQPAGAPQPAPAKAPGSAIEAINARRQKVREYQPGTAMLDVPAQDAATVPVPTVAGQMNNLETARKAAGTEEAAVRPIIINNTSPPAPQPSFATPPAPSSMPAGSATINGTNNRFQDKLLGGNVEHLP